MGEIIEVGGKDQKICPILTLGATLFMMGQQQARLIGGMAGAPAAPCTQGLCGIWREDLGRCGLAVSSIAPPQGTQAP